MPNEKWSEEQFPQRLFNIIMFVLSVVMLLNAMVVGHTTALLITGKLLGGLTLALIGAVITVVLTLAGLFLLWIPFKTKNYWRKSD